MAVLMWSVLLLAASVSCSPVEEKLNRPDWLPEEIQHPDWIPLPPQHPEWIPWPPQHPDWIPLPPQHPEWIPWPPQHPEWIPLPPQHPEWIPWPPQHPDWIPLPPQHPEWIPWPPNKPSWWPDHIIEWDSIDWPTGKPEWWPELDWEAGKPEWFPEIDWENLERPVINEGVAGTPASIEDLPSIVQIEIGAGEIWAQGCVGSVLTSLHILTPANCFIGRYKERFRRIRAGSGERGVGGIVIPVDSVLIHPSRGQSEENRLDGDISIARLTYFLTFGSTIAQTSIVSDGYQLPNELPLTLASWGTTAQGSKKTDDNLYKIDLVNLDAESCNAKWNELTFGLINVSSNSICALRPETGGRNIDIRDIGAPLYYDNILVGLLSWGNPLGNQTFPAVATSVASYTNWIIENAA